MQKERIKNEANYLPQGGGMPSERNINQKTWNVTINMF